MKNLLWKSLAVTVLMAFLIAPGCKHDPIIPIDDSPPDTTSQTSCNPDTVYFQNAILPLLQASCAQSGCHDAKSKKEGVILDSYANILKTGKVKPGNPNGSELVEVLTESGDERMPPPPLNPLSTAQIQLIRKWIQQGATNNYCDDGTNCDTLNVTYSGIVKPMLDTYCNGCHANTSSGGGILLTSHALVLERVNSGQLLGSVTHAAGYAAMPVGGNKLSDCKINQVKAWIHGGAKNN